VVETTTNTPAANALENIAPSAGGSTDASTNGGETPTSSDQAGNYILQDTSTGVVTHDQPQSSGNSKPTGVPNLFRSINNGITGGTRSDENDGVLTDVPSM
jgi:hypothetical protein